jgi:hypothetical protein
MLVSIGLTSTTLAETPHQSLAQYKKTLDQAVTHLKNSSSPAKIKPKIEELFKLSQTITKSYAQRYGDCEAYLSKALAVADQMPQMKLETIERDYHQDHALPKAGTHCYHVKDLLVHPATVLVLMSQSPEKHQQQMYRELAELDAHLTFVMDRLTKETASK